jgi:iron complex outermembrane receptor protein
LTLEELLDIEVTSVSRKPEKRQGAAAAVFVVTQDDIRRSGATSLPEVLRMVPGIHVARLDANKWSVSCRGFSGRYSNKLLVLIDGRSVYTPLFSGVEWEARDVLLEDVERIEVVRGPGGAMWGANAVNGVINIVTKKATDTRGGLISGGVGTEEQGFGSLRYGGRLGENGAYRFYAKYLERDAGTLASGDEAHDGWDAGRTGFRVDWEWDDDRFTLQGDAFRSDVSQTYELPDLRFPYRLTRDADSEYSGGNVLGRWTRVLSDDSSVQLQAYVDLSETEAIDLDERRLALDIDFQHELRLGERHGVVWGAGFRYTDDDMDGTRFISFDPEKRRYRLFSGFVEDQIALVEDRLRLTLGTKFEYHDLSGLEVQPNVRLAWTPAERHTVWLAASRAVRTPSRSEADGRLAALGFPGGLVALLGDEDFDSEALLAFEVGYRCQITEELALDASLFHNLYDDFRTVEIGMPYREWWPWPPHLLIPFYVANNADADTYGVELALDWKPVSRWRTRLSYTFLEVDVDVDARTFDYGTKTAEGDAPQHQVYWQNSLDLPRGFELDTTLRYVDELPSLDVDDYVTADVRLGWRPSEDLELAVVGQNLFDSEHFEFAPMFVNTVPTQVERSVYGKVTWRF